MTIDHGGSHQVEAVHAVYTPDQAKFIQEPIAVVGMACRLPGNNNSPLALWDFLKRGGIAHNEAPESRFNLSTHHDGSKKPKTMRSPGGMFLENVDPQDFDAQFFGISRTDAIAMDPQQRQLLEVVYEGLENSGITLEKLDGAPVGCFVGASAVDYADMQSRDPDDRAPSITIGVGRAILSNRISHFLNIKGPSMTIDTACSSSLVGLDLACRYLGTREINGAIVAASNIYLSPEHNMDGGGMKGAHSLSGRCHTFDVNADGYIKAEGVNAVILKRLDDAVKDGDPIRAVIRGSATNSDGRTPGIASPSAEAQVSAIRAAYANAGIADLNNTTYIECHGTGTQAGDPIEVQAVSSIFAETRSFDNPLIIGSIKSNIGHSEPAAGISGLLKAILCVENGWIPGNPTFNTPNPKIDFQTLKVRASRTSIPWPEVPVRRASVNSFGFGGSNAHVVLDDPKSFLQRSSETYVSSLISDYNDFFDEKVSVRPYVLVFSGNDENSLRAYCKAISKHLISLNSSVKLSDLSYTLSERRSRHFHRAYVVAQSTTLAESAFVFGKKNPQVPRIGFVFTGQGAQWPQMGKAIIETFPIAKPLLNHLDDVLQALPEPPSWSLLSELVEPRSAEHLRLPEFSQPLVTALQLVILAVLESWEVHPQSVVGHSSGEIAAAYATGYITREEAIRVAYFRGQAPSQCEDEAGATVGMLAVGLGADEVQGYIQGAEGQVKIGCYNSPNSVTLSGNLQELKKIRTRLETDHHFARLLQVDLAYHSDFMINIGNRYHELLLQNCETPLFGNGHTTMFSSVTGHALDQGCDADYWMSNTVNPVLFDRAVQAMVSGRDGADFLIEIGPSGALAGPIAQIKKALPGQGSHIQYCTAASRGQDTTQGLFEVAGTIFISGGSIALANVNADQQHSVRACPPVVVDLPNYVWNHSTKYWHESESSKDWRFRQFSRHDLLGSKVLGTSWNAPSWKNILRLEDLPWLKDHRMGHEIVFPAAGYIAMAVEAIYQTTQGVAKAQGDGKVDKNRYRIRNITFSKALVLEESEKECKVMLTLAPRPRVKDSWHEFKISSLIDGVWHENSHGLIRLEKDTEQRAAKAVLLPLAHATSGHLWYKAMTDAGYSFGPSFQKHLEVESISGVRQSRSTVSLVEPLSEYPQSSFPMHPACIDGCLQTTGPSLWKGNRTNVNAVLVPAIIDSIIINSKATHSEIGISVTSSKYVGVGRPEETKNYMSDASVYDSENGSLLLQFSGLRYHTLDTREDLHATHNYSRVAWKPDITFISQEKLVEQVLKTPQDNSHNIWDQNLIEVNQVIDLIAHKKPTLKVLEINLRPNDSTSIWLDGNSFDKSSRAATRKHVFATMDANALIAAQEKYETLRNTDFIMLDLTNPPTEFSSANSDVDLAIVKLGTFTIDYLRKIIHNVRSLVSQGSHVLLIEEVANSSSDDLVHINGQDPKKFENCVAVLETGGFCNTLEIPSRHSKTLFQSAYLSVAGSISSGSSLHVDIVHFSRETTISSEIRESLTGHGWEISEHLLPTEPLPPKNIVLVVDELSSPILSSIRVDQWQSLQQLINGRSRILWVTTGSQLEVTNPDNALIHGLARTVRAEDPSINLTTLDVESSSSDQTIEAINTILKSLQIPPPRTHMENEFVERHGIINISRILPDELINQAETDDSHGAEVKVMRLHESETCIRLRCERVGTLDSLCYAEVSARELPLKDNCVEIEVVAAGVNFKDIAVAMGIVPENQHLLGLEGAGVIRRVGRLATAFRVGQRVMVVAKGTFGNRVIATTERTYPIPDSLSFEDAATMPSVYLTTLYSLFNLANTQKGHRVLVHSASGGVGISSIQLCQYIGAQVYATVGTEEKRKFLIDTFQIPSEHIFNSRSTAFASELMTATNGEGVDVIINSLTGDLLDESWRCIANGGTMVELGMKDMLDRNSLSMEPFRRSASYRGCDMSHKNVSDAMIARLLTKLMDLFEKGHIKPISPVKLFSFEDIASAFYFMRGGSHIGKIVISNGSSNTIDVPVRPAARELLLRTDKSYLIIGGLKGLCGSLAIYLAKLGAKHLVILSRSGYADKKSQGVLKNLRAEGSQVDLIEGDVSVLDDVRRAFKSATVAIGGLVQGAMVLRDKIFTSMTVDEYHQTIQCKVQGTWNLHRVSLEQKSSLDFFTMLSSISGVVGQKGQANYSAANVFLDNFSVYRHSLGLAANSVDLGAIEDVGYIHEHSNLVSLFDSAALTPINERLFHKIIRFSILQQVCPINAASASQLITSLAVPQPENSALLADARFGGLRVGHRVGGKGSSEAKDGSKDIQAFFLLLHGKAESSVVLAALVEIVNAQFTKILRLGEPMEPAKSMASYGLDSLAAVEFRNWVRMELGAELTTLEITNASSLFSICEKIIAKIATSDTNGS